MTTPRDPQVAEPEVTTTTDYVVRSREELEQPYRIILENDDLTPMDIVVLVLTQIFDLPPAKAVTVMLEAHAKGRALVTVLPFEEAQARVYAAQSIARDAGFPLSFYLEPDA